MDIIRENAGAESVVLVLESNGEFLVQGVKTAAGAPRVLVGRAVAPVGRLLDGNRELRAAHVGARRARRRRAAGQVPRRRVRHEPAAEVRALRAGCAQGQAHRRGVSREQSGRRRVHAGPARGAEHPDVAGRRVDRQRDALQPPGAAEPRDRSRQRDADEGDRRAQTRRRRAQPLQGSPRGPRQGTHARARERAGPARRSVAARRHGRGRVGRAAQRRQRHEQRQRRRQRGAREPSSALPVEGVTRAVGLLEENAHRLAEYLAADPVGRKLPDYSAQARRRPWPTRSARSSATSTSSPSTSST